MLCCVVLYGSDACLMHVQRYGNLVDHADQDGVLCWFIHSFMMLDDFQYGSADRGFYRIIIGTDGCEDEFPL